MNTEEEEYNEEEYIEPSTYMMPQCKRGKGKVKGCLAIRDMYKYYLSLKEGAKKDEIISYIDFARITKECNKELINQVVNHSEAITLPYRLGVLQVSKFERKFYPSKKNKWTIDYQKSREEGVLLYHDTPFIYKWRWKKHSCVVKNKTGYKFRANRASKRAITVALKNGRDFFQ